MRNKSVTPPVLFVIFNRPEYTEKSFAAIRKAKPAKLYIAADGARQIEGEKELCEQTRNLVLNSIDWECKVKTLFRDKNLGCGRAISEAITWFFENEPEGIIVEDDCVANPSFFKFCGELLEKYRDNEKIWMICGTVPPYFKENIEDSYFFSRQGFEWGWATWANRWLPNFKLSMKDYDYKNLEWFYDNKEIAYILEDSLALLKSQASIDTWDFPWYMCMHKGKALAAIAAKNLVENIGDVSVRVDSDNAYPNLTHLPTFDIYEQNKLTHPSSVEMHPAISHAYEKAYFYGQEPCPRFLENLKIPQDKQIYLWGAGIYGLQFLAQCERKGVKITSFLDSNEQKQKSLFEGYKVISPQEVLQRSTKDFFIIVSNIKYSDEIIKICEDVGLIKGKDFLVF